MIPTYDKVHNRLRINGFSYDRERLTNLASVYVKEGEPYMKSIGNFLLDWLDNNDYIEAFTSGSTGTPKIVHLKKQHMVHSAIATGDFLGLRPGNTALCCLPADFIAGKMMLVRAIVLGLELEIVIPSSMPLALTEKDFDFSAMIPMQASKSFYDLGRIKKLILGGGAIEEELEERLQNISTQVYCSYGMTETITHVAMRKVNHTEDASKVYKAMPNVIFSVDERNCLIIDAPKIADKVIKTNDVVDLVSSTEFKWVGRQDNMINSGGFKIFPESVEKKIEHYIKEPYFITNEEDEVYGQIAVLFIEAEEGKYDGLLRKLHHDKKILRYEIPKKIYYVDKFERTESHKIKRGKTAKKYREKG